MYRAGILLCIIALGLHFWTGSTTTSFLYHCTSINATQATIQIDALPDGYKGLCVDATKCGQVTDSNGVTIIPSCPVDTDIVIALTKLSDFNICGGDGAKYYKLYCYTGKIDAIGFPTSFQRQKVSQIDHETIPPHPSESYDLLGLSMNLYDLTKTNTRITSAEIGTELSVIISGPSGPAYHVQSCNATDTINTLELIINGDTVRGSQNSAGMLMSGFTPMTTAKPPVCNASQICMQAIMHVFHFKGSNTITLACAIDICHSKTEGGCAGQSKSFNDVAHRKKRESEPIYGRYLLVSAISIHDHLRDPEHDTGNIIGFSFCLVWTTTAAAVLYVSNRNF